MEFSFFSDVGSLKINDTYISHNNGDGQYIFYVIKGNSWQYDLIDMCVWFRNFVRVYTYDCDDSYGWIDLENKNGIITLAKDKENRIYIFLEK
ncbi:hypothetical protein DMC14_002565 [Metamycoplasma phocicerebrale]|uniref:Uncharacterized protein n=1 Tax=Metamycoplasma phocicerebrale TaxID=142649 RepID=A0A3T0TUF6_9BACT|nr:hypothetical protein [Metamycoplasma phocicerebrale]AZZ65653.1 hypothetical protein DMC14_002565 [Metamycoplasma phocicerebrale]